MSRRGQNKRERGKNSTAAKGAAKRHARVEEIASEKAPPAGAAEKQAKKLLVDMGLPENVPNLDRATLYFELRSAIKRNASRATLDRQVMASLGSVAKAANSIFEELQRTAEAERSKIRPAGGPAPSNAPPAPTLRPELAAKASEWNEPITSGAK